MTGKEIELAVKPSAVDQAAVTDSRDQAPHTRKLLSTAERRMLVRELAEGLVKRADLARKYGVTRAGITMFAKRHAREIDEIREQLDNEFAGQWIAKKELRIEQYQRDLEKSEASTFGNHYEQIRTRAQLLRNVAEELGQLPTRGNITVIPVQHVIVGIDMDELM